MSTTKSVITVKYEQLKSTIAGIESLIVAYSGGVDSSFLLKTAFEVLENRALAVTAVSPSLPRHELEQAREIARGIGAPHIEIESHELENPDYLSNSVQRCYFCKSEVYSLIGAYASRHGYQTIADGTNVDDQGDYRPGRQAAREWGVRSLLLEVGLYKTEIRELARESGLPDWDKPASPCLSSRVPYGVPISVAVLSQIEHAERLLHHLGFREVRVRTQDHTARIEVSPDEFPNLISQREKILQGLKSIGYVYVALDLAGFRSGSLNETSARHGR